MDKLCGVVSSAPLIALGYRGYVGQHKGQVLEDVEGPASTATLPTVEGLSLTVPIPFLELDSSSPRRIVSSLS